MRQVKKRIRKPCLFGTVFVLGISAFVIGGMNNSNLRESWSLVSGIGFKLSRQLLRRPNFNTVCKMEKVKSFCNSRIFSNIFILRQYGLDGPFSTEPRNFPVLVTGADTSHYLESQGLIQSLDKHLRHQVPELKLIYYDLGLKTDERKQLTQHCKCEVRFFKFNNYPPHVRNLKNYAFKPIIVATVMHEYSAVWWMDASVRILGNVSSAIQQMHTDDTVFFIEPSLKGAPVYRTSPHTFNYFNASPSFYLDFEELAATTVIFKSCDILDFVASLWATCALLPDCINPVGAKADCGYETEVTLADIGKCHRYDQSVLNIMLWKIFLKTPFTVHTKWMIISRDYKVKYFPGS